MYEWIVSSLTINYVLPVDERTVHLGGRGAYQHPGMMLLGQEFKPDDCNGMASSA